MNRVPDNIIIESYRRLRNVWKVGKEVGLCGQSVHERIKRLGIKTNNPQFTDKEKKILLDKYIKYRDAGNIQGLAIKLGRTKYFICRKARELGLTNPAHHRPYIIKKGGNPYFRQHARIRKRKGSPKFCQKCGENNPKKWYDWANLTGDYDNPDDYMRMCRKCHREYDNSVGQCFFYACGPNGEMIIWNNQSEVAKEFGLSSGSISLCLHNKQRIHKGWAFKKII